LAPQQEFLRTPWLGMMKQAQNS